MAYNLQSLITILEQILNPEQTRWIVDHNEPQLQSLLEKAVSLQQILEKSPLTKIESLESQIRDAAYKAEDIIESNMVDQMLSTPHGLSFTFSTPNLQQVMQQLDSAMEQVVKLVKGKTMSSGSSSSGESFLHEVDSVKSKAVVGVDADLAKLKDRAMGMQSKLEIVPIVGMGGIGKTTLARKLFQDPAIVEHFTCLAWTTVSQDYNMQAILLNLLRGVIGNECDQHAEKESKELKDILYRSLYGRRYLIVLDDIWSTMFWDEIRRYFPDNNKGSRIVITTRESDVAKHADSQSVQHRVQLLNWYESWHLLCQIVFGGEKCPRFLQGIGEKIASDCGGLPLAIVVIGGLLSKVERSIDVWENVAKDVRTAIAKSDEQFSNILSLSYNHLPNNLKPCFLYMGAFPEDYQIKTSKLIHLWIAEGFVKKSEDKSLEEEAWNYLKALAERNLLLVKHEKWNGKAKICSIHDLLRDLCMRKAYEDKFLHVKKSPDVTLSICDILIMKCLCMREANEESNSRRVSVDTSSALEDVYPSAKWMSLPLARSFLLQNTDTRLITRRSYFIRALRLVRVMDVMDVRFREFPAEILQLVNLRFLAVWCVLSIPSEISRLCNLQTFIARIRVKRVPFEVLELSELKHFKLVNGIMRFEDEYVKQIVAKNLLTISLVFLTRSRIWNAFLESIPNIKDLGIFYADDLKLGGVDLSHLHKLETLRCESVDIGDSRRFWSTLKFPLSLRKLTLCNIAIFPRVWKLLCVLPNLEVLKIKSCGFEREDEELEAPDQAWEAAEDEDEDEDEDVESEEAEVEEAFLEDEEWELAEGDEFRSLQFLSLENLRHLKRWRADETNFPRLRHLHLSYCGKLEEIPSGIGEIPTLQLIELVGCSHSAVASAKQIEEVQQSDYGNYDLKLRLI